MAYIAKQERIGWTSQRIRRWKRVRPRRIGQPDTEGKAGAGTGDREAMATWQDIGQASVVGLEQLRICPATVPRLIINRSLCLYSELGQGIEGPWGNTSK